MNERILRQVAKLEGLAVTYSDTVKDDDWFLCLGTVWPIPVGEL